MKNLFKLSGAVFAMGLVFLIASCGGDDDGPEITAPTAAFDFVIGEDGLVTFTDLSVGADSYEWDFGDMTGTSTMASPTYTYTASGTYTVTLTVTNAAGTDENSTTVTIVLIGTNLVVGGDFTDDSAWRTRQIWTDDNNGVDHAIIDEEFVWDIPEGNRWANFVLWQEIEVEAGVEYTFSADLASDSGVDIWFEVFLSNQDPNADGDYSPKLRDANGDLVLDMDGNEQNTRRLHTGGACTGEAFDGEIVSILQPCSGDPVALGEDGKFTLEAHELTANGTIYLAFKSGCGSDRNYDAGLRLDNVSIIQER
ncbi:MAG: PKD domain-containing protein [Bacteroidota bacterium]